MHDLIGFQECLIIDCSASRPYRLSLVQSSRQPLTPLLLEHIHVDQMVFCKDKSIGESVIALEKSLEARVSYVSRRNGINLKLIEDGHSIREDCLMRFNSVFIATHLRELAGNSTQQVIILYISCGSIHELTKEMKL